jgi:very-short-patch-repair endonuclease
MQSTFCGASCGIARPGRRFRRQEPVSGYIVDFYSPRIQLAIEVDGPVHDGQRLDDLHRDMKLASLNVQVLRFTNDAVINDLGRVVAVIREIVDAREKSLPFRVSSRSYPARAPSGRGGKGGAS